MNIRKIHKDFKKAFRRIYGYDAFRAYKEERLYLAGRTDAIITDMEYMNRDYGVCEKEKSKIGKQKSE